jgi:hypothetical protein
MLRTSTRGRASVKPYLSSKKGACVVLYYHLWPVWPHHNCLHYTIKGTIFGKNGIEHKNACFDLRYKFYLKHFSFQQEFGEILT